MMRLDRPQQTNINDSKYKGSKAEYVEVHWKLSLRISGDQAGH